MTLLFIYLSGGIATMILSRIVWGKSEHNGEKWLRFVVSMAFSWLGFIGVLTSYLIERIL